MSGIGAQLLTHVVRRGLEQYPAMDSSDFDVSTQDPDYNLEIGHGAMAAIVLIVLVTGLLIVSVDYTVGSVIASLSMIESPSTTTFVDPSPPAYTDEPEAPITKKSLNNAAVELNNAEVLVVANKPVTSSIRASIKHLGSVGGYFARWRGLFQAILYSITTGMFAIVFGAFFELFLSRPIGGAVGAVLATIATCQLHMLWTHSMIAMPTSIRWYRRFIPRKQAKAIFLPTLVFALARQMCVFVPMAMAGMLGVFSLAGHDGPSKIKRMDGVQIFLLVLRLLAIPVAMFIVMLFVYLPAAATLVRVEACLLPESQETVVPFDREAIVGDIDLSQRNANKQLFRSAWKSFNNAARLRLVKVFVKLFAFQFVVLIVGFHLVLAVLFTTSRDKIAKGINNIM